MVSGKHSALLKALTLTHEGDPLTIAFGQVRRWGLMTVWPVWRGLDMASHIGGPQALHLQCLVLATIPTTHRTGAVCVWRWLFHVTAQWPSGS